MINTHAGILNQPPEFSIAGISKQPFGFVQAAFFYIQAPEFWRVLP